VGRSGRRIAERAAHLCQAVSIKPAIAHSLSDRPAISLQFAGTDMVVSALMVKHEELHSRGLAIEQARIHDQDSRHRHTEVGKMPIQQRPHATAAQVATSNADRSVALQGHR
jgi:hypothetical protein